MSDIQDRLNKLIEEETAKLSPIEKVVHDRVHTSMVAAILHGDAAIHTNHKGETTIIPKDELPDWVKFYLDTKK